MSFLVSLLFGVAVGVAYALSGVRSPAPPLVALVGLLGMVAGEGGVTWWKDRRPPAQELVEPGARAHPGPTGEEPR